jgi:hypothetical protein
MVSADGREKDFDVYERAAVEFGYDGQYWLGMDDIEREGFYVWSDGRTWDGQEEQYEDWGDEEPSRTDAQDCVATEEAGSWADFDCQATQATICEPLGS